MLIDSQEQFSSAQAVTTTASSTDIIDFQAVRDMGSGEPIYANAITKVAFAGGTSLRVDVQVSTDEAFTSPITIITGQVHPVASLVKGFELLRQALPSLDADYRYMRFNYVTVGTFSAGTVAGQLVLGIDTVRHYPKGYQNAGDA